MAERRMFAKTIIDSDAFLDMPLSTQALYFHLSMRADDDGFINNPKKIQRMIGAADDDLKVLVTKKFIIPFESGIVVIKHWKIHNYIRGDRKKETVYAEEMNLLEEKDNGTYTLKTSLPVIEVVSVEDSKTMRQKAYEESSLPYSFEYKVKKAFEGKPCPCCGSLMQENFEDGIITKNRIPSIQHNLPISKGGKHELGNISVICKECNVSLRDTETSNLNEQEVIDIWDSICEGKPMSVTCQSDVSQVSGTWNTQVRLGKDSIGKYSIDKDSIDKDNIVDMKQKKKEKESVKHKYGEFKHVLLTDNEYKKLEEQYGSSSLDTIITYLDEYLEMKGTKYKSHYMVIKKWGAKAALEQRSKEGISIFKSFLES